MEFDDQPLPAVVARVLARPAASPFAYLVTPNSDHLARLRRQPALLPLYTGAWMCLLDSRLLANLADRLRVRRPAVPGRDLVAALLPELAERPGNAASPSSVLISPF